MTAQTGRAPEAKVQTQDQVTPVIIKSASGGPDPLSAASNSVSIESLMAFKEAKPGPTWESSQSTKRGRITEVSVRDGLTGIIVDYPIDPSDKLVSVSFRYGAASVVFKEYGDPRTEKVVLLINSTVPFTAKDLNGQDWSDSDATFPNRITSLIIMAGDSVIVDQNFADPNAFININFMRFKD